MAIDPAAAAPPPPPPPPPPEVPPEPPPEAPQAPAAASGPAPATAPAAADPASAPPQGPPPVQDTYEAARPTGPVDLSGGAPPPMGADDYFKYRYGETAETGGAGNMMMLKANDPPKDPNDPGDPTQLTPAQAAAEPPLTADQRADPNRVGVVINNPPDQWPSAQELKDAGVTGVRITMSKDNYTPNNQGAWNDKLAEYQKAQIDVTLNVPAEGPPGNGPPPVPVQLMEPYPETAPDGTQTVRKTEEGDTIYKVIPFTRDGTRTDQTEPDGSPKKLTDEQAKLAQKWYGDFDTWKRDAYVPSLQNAQATLGSNVNRYEIWNEPDEPANWHHDAELGLKGEVVKEAKGYSPGIPPQAFGELLKTSKETLDAGKQQRDEQRAAWAGPEAQKPPELRKPVVVAGGLDSGQPGYLKDAMKATGDTLYADEIAVHPYLKQPDQKYRQYLEPGEEPQGFTGDFAFIAGKDQYGQFNKPIEFTEVGDKRPGQKNYIPQAATAITKLDPENVRRGYFFWENPYDGSFGLHRRTKDGQLKPNDALGRLEQRTHLPAP